jgi:CRISPR-associated protein Cst2
MKKIPVNRVWIDEKEDHEWKDATWKAWTKKEGETYIDDDLLGYMKAEGGKTEGEKGRADKRRGVLEIARAISMTPFSGDITFNAKSGEKGRTSLYGTECHTTRYRYGFAMTPERLADKSRVVLAIEAIVHLGEVAGNHSRFLFDFSPESIVLRLTDDPAPRLLYCFKEADSGTVQAPELVRRVQVGDIAGAELYVGGKIAQDSAVQGLEGVHSDPGVKTVLNAFIAALKNRLDLKG